MSTKMMVYLASAAYLISYFVAGMVIGTVLSIGLHYLLRSI